MQTTLLGRLGATKGAVAVTLVGLWLALVGAACDTAGGNGNNPDGQGLSGTIEIDGSSTVFPITEAVAEEFRSVEPDVRVNVGVSGTGGGFTRFTSGQTTISDASRPIRDSEAQQTQANGIEYVELTVAIDGLAVVVNPQNDFVDCLTAEELKRIWEPGSQINNWRDVRPEFPDQPLRLYGPGTDSGTFDYFTEVIVGEAGASRPDYNASEDDNFLVQGISGDRNALGYFGYAYYAENQGLVRLIAVDGGSGCVAPSNETVQNGAYAPLSRPIFIYVNTNDLRTRPEVEAFVRFYLDSAPILVPAVGYVALAGYESEAAEVNAALQQAGGPPTT
jgi:phosphate transport system substrate-binding protein